MADGMEFGLLGPMLVRRGGAVVQVPRGAQRVFLATLLLRANHGTTTHHLIEALWENEDKAPRSAPQDVTSYIRRLRATLKDNDRSRIVTCSPGYLIRVYDGEFDVARFEVLVKAARTAVGDGSWRDAHAHADAALAMCRGDPLADVGSAFLERSEARRLTELRLQMLETRLDADLELGNYAGAVAELQKLTETYPLQEHFYAQLMLALYRSGRRSEAKAVYLRAYQVIMDEVGDEPGRALREMQRRVLDADPALDVPAQAAARPRPRVPERDLPPAGAAGQAAEHGPADYPPSSEAGSPRSSPRLIWAAAAVIIVIAVVLTARVLAAPNPQGPRVYSQPQFCNKSDIGFFCLDTMQGDPVSGVSAQVWEYSAGNASNMFVALQIGTVTDTWPFTNHTLDQKQRAFYQVLELEADPGGRRSGLCLSTADATRQRSPAGNYYYFPVTLRPCDQSSDKNSTWLTWNSYGSPGNPVTMVGLTNKTGTPQQFACLSPENVLYECIGGAQIAAVSPGQNWAHFK